jgi:hypothetical protein
MYIFTIPDGYPILVRQRSSAAESGRWGSLRGSFIAIDWTLVSNKKYYRVWAKDNKESDSFCIAGSHDMTDNLPIMMDKLRQLKWITKSDRKRFVQSAVGFVGK